MQLKEFSILLDIKKSYKVEEFEVVQGDSLSNILNISLVNGLNTFDLTSTNVEIVFRKSDGTTVSQEDIAVINPIQGKMQCVLKTNTIASPGKVIAEIRVLENEILLTSTRFEFHVRQSLITDETIESTNEFPILIQKIKEVNDLIEEVSGMEAIKGDKGEKGDKGDKGDVGPIGPQGDIGPRGLQGIQGEKGETGTSLKILGNYNTVEELEAAHPNGTTLDGGFMVGENYYYWGSNGWENAGSLKGVKGDTGDIGPKGDAGEKGERGEKGSDATVTNENVIDAIGYTPVNKAGDNLERSILQQPQIKDYSETVEITIDVSGTKEINLSNANVFEYTLSGATTFSIANPAPSGQVHSLTLKLIQPSTAVAITFPTSVKWVGDTIPDLIKPSREYIMSLVTTNGGIRWIGLFGGDVNVS